MILFIWIFLNLCRLPLYIGVSIEPLELIVFVLQVKCLNWLNSVESMCLYSSYNIDEEKSYKSNNNNSV